MSKYCISTNFYVSVRWKKNSDIFHKYTYNVHCSSVNIDKFSRDLNPINLTWFVYHNFQFVLICKHYLNVLHSSVVYYILFTPANKTFKFTKNSLRSIFHVLFYILIILLQTLNCKLYMYYPCIRFKKIKEIRDHRLL